MERRNEETFFLFAAPVPFMTRERFAALTGLEEGVLRGMMDRGHLPTLKVGRRRVINLALLVRQCEAAQSDAG